MATNDHDAARPARSTGRIGEIERVIARVREGDVSEDDALEAIGRIARDRAEPRQIYQKSLG